MLGNLLILADSAFPSGSHGHSSGLEFAIQQQWVGDAASLEQWGRTVLRFSLLPSDGRALIQTWFLLQASPDREAGIIGLNRDLAALRPGKLQREASAQVGRSFLRSSLDAWGDKIDGGLATGFLSNAMRQSADFIQYPLAWAIVCSGLAIPIADSLGAYLTASVRQMLQVAVRIMNIGQREALAVQSRLAKYIEALAVDITAEAQRPLASSAFRFDMAGLGHESLERRYFRS